MPAICALNAITTFAIAALAASVPAMAQTDQNWPSRPIKWVVPFPPGGAMDVIARTLGERASRDWGQPVVIENRPGAGGNIGADYAAKQPADGYTILIASIGMATNKALYPRLGYDPVKDFAPVSLLAVVPNVLVVNPARIPDRSVKELVGRAQKAPGTLTYASAGNGTSIHLAGEMFSALAGIQITHIPYKGSAPAVTDMLGGQVDLMFDSITSARPHIQSGKLRPLAVTTTRRSAALPDVPTMAEAGITGYDVSPWFAVFTRAGTPAHVIAHLNKGLNEAMQQPETLRKFESIGAEPIGSTPQELASHLGKELERWDGLIRQRGVRAD